MNDLEEKKTNLKADFNEILLQQLQLLQKYSQKELTIEEICNLTDAMCKISDSYKRG